MPWQLGFSDTHFAYFYAFSLIERPDDRIEVFFKIEIYTHIVAATIIEEIRELVAIKIRSFMVKGVRSTITGSLAEVGCEC